MTVTNLRRAVVSTLSSVPALVLVALFIFYFPIALAYLSGASFGHWRSALDGDVSFYVAWVTLIVAYVLFGRVVAAAASRFLLYLVPVPADGRRRWLAGLGFVAVALLFAVAFGALAWKSSASDVRVPRAVSASSKITPPVAFLVSFAVVLTRRYLCRGPLPGRYVLFLRRFQSFSDQEVVASVFRASRHVPVAFLLSPERRLGNWDPIVVCIAGLQWLRPLRTVPWFMSARDEDWESRVAALIGGAAAVVVDGTEHSTSISREVDLVRASGAWDRAVWLVEKPAASDLDVGAPASITYARGWRWSLSRIGSLAALAVSVVSMVVFVDRIVGMAPTRNWPFGAVAIATLVVVVGLALATLRPAIEPRVAREMEHRLARLVDRGTSARDRLTRHVPAVASIILAAVGVALLGRGLALAWNALHTQGALTEVILPAVKPAVLVILCVPYAAIPGAVFGAIGCRRGRPRRLAS